MIPKRLLCYILIFLITLIWVLSTPGLATTPVHYSGSITTAASAQNLEQQAKTLYEAGRFVEAVSVLQQVARQYQQQGDFLRQAIVLSNLALTYEKLGIWTEAESQANSLSEWSNANVAINASVALLDTSISRTTTYTSAKAQILDVQGRLQMTQGQAEAALSSWEQAAQLYQQLGDREGLIRNQIDQSRALQSLGFYQQASDRLKPLNQALQDQPVSLAQVTALRSLGDAMRAVGDLEANATLQTSLALAQHLPGNEQAEAMALTRLSLGNAARVDLLSLDDTVDQEQVKTVLEQVEMALEHYEAAIALGSNLPRLQADLNRLSLLIDTKQRLQAAKKQPTDKLQTEIDYLPQRISEIYAQLSDLSLNQTAVYAQINFAQSLVKLIKTDQHYTDIPQLERLLAKTQQQADQLNNSRAISYALGTQGELYEVTQRWSTAENYTRMALQFAQGVVSVPGSGFATAPDIRYLWQWQLGRIFKAQANQSQDPEQYQKALAAYDAAINLLESLRLDLVAASQDEQFNFRDSIEPAYREYIQLLLRSAPITPLPEQLTTATALEQQSNLTKARRSLQNLQIAELQNFLRAACINVPTVDLDRTVEATQKVTQAANGKQTESRAALIYPIILPDRLSVVLKLPKPELPLLHYSTEVEQDDVKDTLDTLRSQLTTIGTFKSSESFLQAQQLYNWLIRPASEVLHKTEINTLVFVLDGALQSIPMAALHDGKQYLIENYSVALAPSLEIPLPRSLLTEQLRILIAGVSEDVNIGDETFPGVSETKYQIDEIVRKSEAGNYNYIFDTLQDQEFTFQNLQGKIQNSLFQVVHLITHGKFSSNQEQTFLVSSKEKIKVAQLNQLLRTRSQSQPEPLELLVLSACETAEGGSRAALGMAGVAVRAGARSTVASLWTLEAPSAAILLPEFYRRLQTEPTKAEALRKAQLLLLQLPDHQHPIEWAPLVLLGNWL